MKFIMVLLAVGLLAAQSNARPSRSRDCRIGDIWANPINPNTFYVCGPVLEWEYKGVTFDDEDYSSTVEVESKENRKQSNIFPSRRIGPGSWHDSGGNWWIFGGQGPSARATVVDQSKTAHFLSDLWVYSSDKTLSSGNVSSPLPSSSFLDGKYSWKLVFRPDVNSDSPYSSYPENFDFPLLCGSETSKHLALYGAHKNNPRAPESHNSPFSEDNVVWLYDIPKHFIQEKVLGESGVSLASSSSQTKTAGSSGSNGNEEETKKRGCNWSSSPKSCAGTQEIPQENQGYWTSYVCCDACLPDGNTTQTFEFCPQFSRDVISYCSQDSLMMLELLLPVNSTENLEKDRSSIYSTSTTTFTSGVFDKNVPVPSQSQHDDNVDENSEERETFSEDMTTTTVQKVASSSSFIKHQIIPKNESIQSHMNLHLQNVSKRERRRSTVGGNHALRKEKTSQGKPTSESTNENSNTNFLKSNQKEQENRAGQEEKKRTELTVSEEKAGDSMGERKSEKMKRNGRNVIKDAAVEEKNSPAISSSNIGQQSGSKASGSGISITRTSLNWWKFDLVSTEWIKMPEVSIEGELTDQIQNGDCRAVVSKGSKLVYILCPTKGNLLNRAVLLFNSEMASVQLLGTIHLNNAFTDKKVWQLGRSVLHAIHCDNHTIIFLAYHKLLDLWIHDHSSNRLFPVENVWKGSSLHTFQKISSFYKVSISLPIPSSSSSETFAKQNKNLRKSRERINEKPEYNSNQEEKMHSTYSFFMVNPRAKLANFEDWYPKAHFHITIVSDREVFLPPRDATYLISSTEFQSEGDFVQNLSSSVNDDVIIVNNSSAIISNYTRVTPTNAPMEEKAAREKEDKVEIIKESEHLLSLVSQRNSKGNEPYLSQTVHAVESNHPLRGQSEQATGENPFNPKSDKKYLQYKKTFPKVVASPRPTSQPIGKNVISHNEPILQTSHFPLIARDTSHSPGPDSKSNINDDHVPNFTTTITTTLASKRESIPISSVPSQFSLLSQEKSNKMAEHRRTKYRTTDIKSLKRKPFNKQQELVRSGQGSRTNTIHPSKKQILGIIKAAATSSPTFATESTSHSEQDIRGWEKEISSTITPTLEAKKTGSKTEIKINRRTGLLNQAQVVSSTKRNNSLVVEVGNLTDNDQIQNSTSASNPRITMQLASSHPQKNQSTKAISWGKTAVIVQQNSEDKSLKISSLVSKANSAAGNNNSFNGKNAAKSQVQREGSNYDDITIFNHSESNNTEDMILQSASKDLIARLKEEQPSRKIQPGKNKQNRLSQTERTLPAVMTTDRGNGLDSSNRNFKVMTTEKNNGTFFAGMENKMKQHPNVGIPADTTSRVENEAALNLRVHVGHEVSLNSHGFPVEEHPSASASPSNTNVDSGAEAMTAASSSHSLFSYSPLATSSNSNIPKRFNGETQTETGSLTDDIADSDVNVNQPHEQRHYSTKDEESLNSASFQKPRSKESDQQLHPSFVKSVKSAAFFSWNKPSNLSSILPERASSSRISSNITSKLAADFIRNRDDVGKNYIQQAHKLNKMVETPEKRATDSIPPPAEVSSSAAVTFPVSSQSHRQPQNDESNSDKSVKSSTPLIMASRNFISTQNIIHDDQYLSSPLLVSPSGVDSKSNNLQLESDRVSSSRNNHNNHDNDPPHSVEESAEFHKNFQQIMRSDSNNNQFSTLPPSLNNNNNNYYVNSLLPKQDKDDGELDVDSNSGHRPMTYGSSEIVVDRRDDILPYGQEGSLAGDTSYSPMIFFGITLSFFASIGVVLFIRRCVKCPPRRESVLIKEPPPIRYSDLSSHTPIV